MKETFNTIVAIMTLANGKKYVTTCKYSIKEYDNLKDTIYKSASRELKQAMNEGCDIEAYSVCPAKNAEELKNMLIYRYATDDKQFGYNIGNKRSSLKANKVKQSTEDEQDSMTLDVSEIVVTSSRKRPVIIEDIISHKKARYESIIAVAKALNSKYITIFKYINEQRLVNNRYRITYAD